VPWRRFASPWLSVNGLDAHHSHQSNYVLAIDLLALSDEHFSDSPTAKEGRLRVNLVYLFDHWSIPRFSINLLVKEVGPINIQQFALVAN
jgi:hypothetical protein